jgi:hypothetical protein
MAEKERRWTITQKHPFTARVDQDSGAALRLGESVKVVEVSSGAGPPRLTREKTIEEMRRFADVNERLGQIPGIVQQVREWADDLSSPPALTRLEKALRKIAEYEQKNPHHHYLGRAGAMAEIARAALADTETGAGDETCGRLLVGQGDDTYDPLCQLPKGHAGSCSAKGAG